MRRSIRALSLMTGFAALAVAVGCGKNSSGSASNTPVTNPAPVAATGGAGLFASHCAKCHATEAGARSKSPNLAGIGSKPDKNADWIATHIKNPQSQNPQSKMPAFADKLSDADVKSIAEYLTTLK
jgi:cytochrome c oxidase subunit 2